MRAARIIVGVIAAAALLVPAAAASPQRASARLTALESGVLVQINTFRRANGLAPVRMNVKLSAAARVQTVAMANGGFFAHESADGSSFWKRIQSFYASSPWRFWSVGENLLWSSPDVSAKRAMQMWVDSPEHRKVLMNPAWREIGIAAVHQVAAPGVYKGLDVTIVTTDFGVRR